MHSFFLAIAGSASERRTRGPLSIRATGSHVRPADSPKLRLVRGARRLVERGRADAARTTARSDLRRVHTKVFPLLTRIRQTRNFLHCARRLLFRAHLLITALGLKVAFPSWHPIRFAIPRRPGCRLQRRGPASRPKREAEESLRQPRPAMPTSVACAIPPHPYRTSPLKVATSSCRRYESAENWGDKAVAGGEFFRV